ncbi:hypothetical protein JCM10908_005919 [Rhodotorula pacifica]|uniref:uncharacterized protein n=1 Tax=Rhodotorula pacifica TaxID=1495444 RepID=UPI00317B9E2B
MTSDQTSPFKRKPALVRTYGSQRSAPPAAAPRLSALDRLLADSSEDDDDDDQKTGATAEVQPQKKARRNNTVKEKDEGPRRSTTASSSANRADESIWDEERLAKTLPARTSSTRAARSAKEKGVAASPTPSPSSSTRTRNSRSPLKRTARDTSTAAQAAEEEEEAEEEIRPPSPPRRKVQRTDHFSCAAATTAAGATAPNLSESRPHLSARTSSRKSANGTAPVRRKEVANNHEEDEEEDIPPPTAHVPLAERLKKASSSSSASPAKTTSAEPATAVPSTNVALAAGRDLQSPSPSPSPKRARPRPRKAATAPALPMSAPSSFSPTSPAKGKEKQKERSRDSPATTISMAPLVPARPASPIKDLSAVFSRFAGATTSASTSGSSAESGQKMTTTTTQEEDGGPTQARRPAMGLGLKRARSVVGGLAGPSTKRVGRNASETDDSAPPGADAYNVGNSAAPGLLGRTYSQPNIFSSPGREPTGHSDAPPQQQQKPLSPSPSRPALGISVSVPLLHPSSAAAVYSPRSRGGTPSPSPSPSRSALGSPSRRPRSPAGGGAMTVNAAAVSALFAGGGASGNGAGGGGGGGGTTRTYAGSRRTLRAAVAVPDESEPGDLEDSLGDSLPGSFQPRRTESANDNPTLAAPLARRETYASLRLLWGIDAEESLDADEAQDSQDRGARVVGSGTLRKQGEGKRWMDELGWMCDGLRAGAPGGEEGEGGDRGAARASAIELVEKALERDWVRRLKSSGQGETVYLALRSASAISTTTGSINKTSTMAADRVLDTAIAITLALFVKDQRLVEPLFRISPSDVLRAGSSASAAAAHHDEDASTEDDERSDVLEVLKVLLEREWAADEIGEAVAEGSTKGANAGRKGKVLKGDARHLQSLRALIDRSALFATAAAEDSSSSSLLPISIRSLILLTIRSIAFFAPRPIFQSQMMLCSAVVLDRVAKDFVDECKGLQVRLQKYEEGLDLLASPPAQPQVSLSTLSLHLSIFEATSLAGPLAFDLISSPELLPPLSLAFTHLAHVSALLALDQATSTRSSTTAQSLYALRTLVAVLGILLALSSDENWSAALVEADLLPTLVRTTLLSRRMAAEWTEVAAVGAKQEEEEEAPPPSSSEASSATASEASGTTTSAGGGVVTTTTAAAAAAASRAAYEANARLVWDVLSLSVGVLANVLDAADEHVGDALLHLHINPACRGRRKCARVCRCPEEEQQSALSALCQLAIDPLDDAVDSVYQASVHGFLRLALGLSLLSSESAEIRITASLANHPHVLRSVLDALEGFAKLYEEREKARRELLRALPANADADAEADIEMEETQVVEETELEEEEGGEETGGQVRAGVATTAEEEDRTNRMREVVQRLRRRVKSRGVQQQQR